MKKVVVTPKIVEDMVTTGYKVGGDHSLTVIAGLDKGCTLIGAKFEKLYPEDPGVLCLYFTEPGEMVPGQFDLEEVNIQVYRKQNETT